jgi:hypothetical protein
MNMKIVEITEKLYKQEIDPNEAERLLLDLFAVSGSAIEVIKWMAECPYNIDQETVPKDGIDAAPMQVVGNMSLSYMKYKQLCDVAEHYR